MIAPKKSSPLLYQLKLTLLGASPAIWRRVLVHSSIRLDMLDRVIQTAMGWTNSHLHQFIADEVTYAHRKKNDPFDDGFDFEDESKFTLGQIAPREKTVFYYEYDFGDGWEHEVKVEKIILLPAEFKHAVCTAGKMACPPEDCGGIPGFYHLLDVLADSEEEEHEVLKEWAGDYDPTHFPMDLINRQLKRYKVSR